MAEQIGKLQTLTGGISTISKKLGPPNSFAWGRSINFRSDPAQQTTYPQTKKISGSIVTDLPMFGDIAHDANQLVEDQTNTLFFHGNTGNIYKVDSSDVVTKEYTVPDSSGNGICYFAETNQLYIPTNTSITRRDMTTGNYYNNFLETSGGAPINTKALLLVAASSQSATRADTASLSITGDLTLETYIKPTTLPTGTNYMSLISKWDESGAKRSYKLDLIAISNYFGDGSNSSLTISSNTTDSPIDSACTGTSGTKTLTATNASFAAGQVVLIHQTQGINAGQWERGTIHSYSAGTITLENNLIGTYTTGAQVIVVKQYTNVTVNSSVTWKPKAWNGTVGGILVFLANGTFTNNGNVIADELGFSLSGQGGVQYGTQGEGTTGLGSANNVNPNGNGGGTSVNYQNDSPGGGGNANSGNTGTTQYGGAPSVRTGIGGLASGSSDLTTMTFGGQGAGASAVGGPGLAGGRGGYGGAILFLNAVTFINNGLISSKGGLGTYAGGNTNAWYPGASGAGGSVLIKAQTWTNNGTIDVSGGASQISADGFGLIAGAGSPGVIALDYLTSNTNAGTITPSINIVQDSSLASSNGSALRLWISDDGTNTESYTQNIDDPTMAYHLFSVSWQASTSTAKFYQNAQLLGTVTGSKTSINDNTSIFCIGCSVNGSGAKANFADSLFDDTRIWNTVRSSAQIAAYYNQVLSGSENGLVAYYPFDGTVADSQSSGLNNLTANNSPTYSTNIAFFGVTTRGDEDVFLNHTGQTYTLKNALSETSTDKIPFTPTKEPFKSLALDFGSIGTGDVTVTVHDELNNVVATMTVTHADMLTGIYEFKFSSSERIVLNASYHVHAFSSTGDGTLVTGTASDASTAWLKTYFQILVNDQYHMAVQFQNFACIANERYLATLQSGNVYTPHRLIFPSGYRIRSLAFWQQYLVLGMWFGNNITDTDTGKLFFWDGNSDTYIDELDVPQGGINAMLGTQGGLTIIAGYKGAVLEYTGYPSSFRYTARTAANLAFRLPNVAEGDTVEVAPGALTMWNSINRIGVSLNVNSSTIHQGIYSYGQYTDQDPMSVGFDNPLSIGDTTSNSVKIGALITRNAKMYAGFQNGITYGIDVVDENNDPYPTGTLELLITDLGSVASKKLPLVFRRDFEPLVSGQSVSLKWKPDRSSSWLPLSTQSQEGATEVRGIINERVKEAQFAIDWVNTSQSVVFTQTTLESETEDDSIQV